MDTLTLTPNDAKAARRDEEAASRLDAEDWADMFARAMAYDDGTAKP